MSLLSRGQPLTRGVDSDEQVDDIAEIARYFDRLQLRALKPVARVGFASADLLPIPPLGPIAKIELHVEPVSLEPPQPHEHQDGFEPLFTVDHVVDGLSPRTAAVQEDIGKRLVGHDGLDQAASIGVCPDGASLKAGVQVNLAVLEMKGKLVDRAFSIIGVQRHASIRERYTR